MHPSARARRADPGRGPAGAWPSRTPSSPRASRCGACRPREGRGRPLGPDRRRRHDGLLPAEQLAGQQARSGLRGRLAARYGPHRGHAAMASTSSTSTRATAATWPRSTAPCRTPTASRRPRPAARTSFVRSLGVAKGNWRAARHRRAGGRAGRHRPRFRVHRAHRAGCQQGHRPALSRTAGPHCRTWHGWTPDDDSGAALRELMARPAPGKAKSPDAAPVAATPAAFMAGELEPARRAATLEGIAPGAQDVDLSSFVFRLARDGYTDEDIAAAWWTRVERCEQTGARVGARRTSPGTWTVHATSSPSSRRHPNSSARGATAPGRSARCGPGGAAADRHRTPPSCGAPYERRAVLPRAGRQPVRRPGKSGQDAVGIALAAVAEPRIAWHHDRQHDALQRGQVHALGCCSSISTTTVPLRSWAACSCSAFLGTYSPTRNASALVEPVHPTHLDAVVADAQQWRPDVAVVDSVGELLPFLGLNTNSADDYTAAHRRVLTPLARAGACVIGIDHLAKNAESRSQGATGTHAKRRATGGASLRVTLLDTFAPGQAVRACSTCTRTGTAASASTAPTTAKNPWRACSRCASSWA